MNYIQFLKNSNNIKADTISSYRKASANIMFTHMSIKEGIKRFVETAAAATV